MVCQGEDVTRLFRRVTRDVGNSSLEVCESEQDWWCPVSSQMVQANGARVASTWAWMSSITTFCIYSLCCFSVFCCVENLVGRFQKKNKPATQSWST